MIRDRARLKVIRRCVAALAGIGLLILSHGGWPAGGAGQARIPVIHRLHAGSPVQSLTFSGDGRLLVSGEWKTAQARNGLKLWDARAGRLLAVFPELGSVEGVAMSADGRVVGSVTSTAARLWDASTGHAIRSMWLEKGSELWRTLAMTPDGRFLAGADSGNKGGIALLWDARTGALRYRFGSVPYHAWTLGFSRDGRTLVVAAGPDGHALLDFWDVQTGRLVRRLTPDFNVTSLAFSPDGEALATVGITRGFSTVMLWDLKTGQEQHSPLRTEPPRPPGGPHRLAYSPSGRYLAVTWSVGDQGPVVIRLWDLRRQATVFTLPVDAQVVAFSPDGRLLAADAGLDIVVWDVRDALKP